MSKEWVSVVSDKDVHTEHCCIRHGCKYEYQGYHGLTGFPNPKTCTVVLGEKPQSFGCEHCWEEIEEQWDWAHLMNEMYDRGRAHGHAWAIQYDKYLNLKYRAILRIATRRFKP